MKLEIIEYNSDQISSFLNGNLSIIINYMYNGDVIYDKYKEELGKDRKDKYWSRVYEKSILDYVYDNEYFVNKVIGLQNNRDRDNRFENIEIAAILFGMYQSIVQSYIRKQVHFVMTIFYNYARIIKFFENTVSKRLPTELFFFNDVVNIFNKMDNKKIYFIVEKFYDGFFHKEDSYQYIDEFKDHILSNYRMVEYLLSNSIGFYISIDDTQVLFINSSNEKIANKFNYNSCDTFNDFMTQLIYYNSNLNESLRRFDRENKYILIR